jgi:hypothetical protein
MGILLQPNTELIKIHGTDIELTSVYVRIEFVAHPDGLTISVTFKTYLDHAHFLTGDCVHTSIHEMPFDFSILSTETQSIETALNYTAQRFTEIGYTATIIL